MGWEWPKTIVAIDTETRADADPFDPQLKRHSMRCGAACWMRLQNGMPVEWEDATFDAPAEMRAWLFDRMGKDRNLWMFAHNAPFDLQVIGLFASVFRGELLLSAPEGAVGAEHHAAGVLIPDPPPFVLRCWDADGNRLTVLDTHNWFRSPLADIGEMVGRPKGELPGPRCPIEKLKRHCLNDTRIVLDAVRMLDERYRAEGHKSFPWSPAGAAIADWNRTARPSKYKAPTDAEVRRAERSAYYGGRTEIFYAERIPWMVHAMDVNSLYPSVMLGGAFPAKLIESCPHNGAGWNLSAFEAAACVARVRICDHARSWPVRREGRTFWAVGDFETWLCGRELADAIACGSVGRVLEFHRYETADLFTNWIAARLDARAAAERDGRPADAAYHKLAANSLYGKFARLKPEWEFAGEHHDCPPGEWTEWLDCRTDPPTRTARWGPWEWVKTADREHPKAFPAVAAFVTAAARSRMDELRSLAGDDGVYYQATDCLYASTAGRRRLEAAGEVSPGMPGKLRVSDVKMGAWFRSVNAFVHGRLKRVAGIPRYARLTAEWEAEFDRFGGVVDALGRGEGEYVIARRVKAKLHPSHMDGRLSVGGWLQPVKLIE